MPRGHGCVQAGRRRGDVGARQETVRCCHRDAHRRHRGVQTVRPRGPRVGPGCSRGHAHRIHRRGALRLNRARRSCPRQQGRRVRLPGDPRADHHRSIRRPSTQRGA